MNISPGEAKVLSFLTFSGLTLLVQVGILVFAFVAAWRLKLKGIWMLAAAAIVSFFQTFMFFLISSPFNLVDHDTATKYMHFGSGYLSFATMIIALVGWCILAFSRKK
ncbi:MAG: hypothetical protein WAO21_03465 [Verrucomicrobiia bacterium]